MGILTYLKIGGAVFVLLFGIYLGGKAVYKYEERKNAELQAKLDTMAERNEVGIKAAQHAAAVADSLAKIRGRATSEKAAIKQEYMAPDPGHKLFDDVTRKYRVRSDDQGNPANNAQGAGGSKRKAGPKTVPAPN